MNKILFIVFLALFIVSCRQISTNKTTADKSGANNNNASPVAPVLHDTTKLTTIEWPDSTFINMGKMKENDKLNVSFRFKNTGDQPLTVYRAWGTCGCTVPEFPQKPIAPGEEAVIKAVFDSRGRIGHQAKEVYVNANTKPSETSVLTFIVEIVKS